MDKTEVVNGREREVQFWRFPIVACELGQDIWPLPDSFLTFYVKMQCVSASCVE